MPEVKAKLCPICLHKPAISCVNNDMWYCFCDINKHNREMKAESLTNQHRRTKNEIVNYWNDIVDTYMGEENNSDTLPKEIADRMAIKDLDELPMPCVFCEVRPIPYSRRSGQKLYWNCHCANESNHEQNRSAFEYSTARPDELWGSHDRGIKKHAIKEWNENVMEWRNHNVS